MNRNTMLQCIRHGLRSGDRWVWRCGWLLVALLLISSRPAWGEDLLNAVVAIVNDDVITTQDLETVLFIEQPRRGRVAQLPDAERVRLGLAELIEERLILQAARTANITIDGRLVDEQLERVRSDFDSESAFNDSLAQAGLTRAMLRVRYHDQLLMQRALDVAVRANVMVSPSEVARYYHEHRSEMSSARRARARHLFVRVGPETSRRQAMMSLELARRRLERGEAFADVAREHSDGPEADQGGDMGWVAPGQLRPELDRVLFRLPAGQVSERIQSELGYHLLLVEERESGEQWSFDEVELSIREHLFREKFEQQLAQWLAALRERSYIVIKIPLGNDQAPSS